jgi:hypothetical protein
MPNKFLSRATASVAIGPGQSWILLHTHETIGKIILYKFGVLKRLEFTYNGLLQNMRGRLIISKFLKHWRKFIERH